MLLDFKLASKRKKEGKKKRKEGRKEGRKKERKKERKGGRKEKHSIEELKEVTSTPSNFLIQPAVNTPPSDTM